MSCHTTASEAPTRNDYTRPRAAWSTHSYPSGRAEGEGNLCNIAGEVEENADSGRWRSPVPSRPKQDRVGALGVGQSGASFGGRDRSDYPKRLRGRRDEGLSILPEGSRRREVGETAVLGTVGARPIELRSREGYTQPSTVP